MPNTDYVTVVAPENYPGRKYIGRYCYEHHLVWWEHTGEVVKPGEVVHHRDGDRRNNTFDNLEKLQLSRHVAEHVSQRGKTVVILICPSCGKTFERELRQTRFSKGKGKSTFCSRQCIGKMFGAKRPNRASKQDFEVVKRIGR